LRPDRRSARDRHLTAAIGLVALALLATVACSGEQAFGPRDGSALGTAGSAGTAGSMGAGGRGGTGIAGSGDAGAGGDASGAAGTGNGGAAGVMGVAGGGASAGGGSSGTGAGAGGRGGAGGTAGRPAGTTPTGQACNRHDDCVSTWCEDKICCATSCVGACRTCAAMPGTCTLAADGDDPRNDCAETAPAMCGSIGVCNGAGACRNYPSTQECDAIPSCDSTNASVIPRKVCSGSGTCVAAGTVSCNGFRCTQGVCGTTCVDDSACVTGGFCSAGTCVAIPNIAGNGDLETGTSNGWIPANGAGPIAVSSVTAAGVAHQGTYSVTTSSRSNFYHGPGYGLPTGPGLYSISAWGMQRTSTVPLLGRLQVRIACKTNVNPGLYHNVEVFDLPMPQGEWVHFASTVDTRSLEMADCMPDMGGLVRTAMLFINQSNDYLCGGGGLCSELYLDDVVVQVTDQHNLVGNPNFEAGLSDGWGLSAGSSVLGVSTTFAHGGTQSLKDSTRSIPAAGPKYALPIGAARYAFSFWVMHTGTQPRDLTLQPVYECVTPTGPVMPPVIKTETAVPGGVWKQLTGTAVFPPANAPAGCKLRTAAVYVRTDGTACSTQVECPDLYIDDVSITLP
jgi:hypothetical protein